MKRPAKAAAWMVLGLLSIVGCRDWDRFEPVTGGGDPTGGSNSGAGNVGAGDLGGGPQGAGDQGGGPVGGSPLGGSTPVDCGKIDILNDDFEDSLDWHWTADTWAVSVAGGELLVPQPEGEERYFQIDTSASFDFRGRTMVLELSVPPGPNQSLWWDIAGDHNNYLEFFITEDGVLNYGYEIDDNFVIFDNDPYDPVAHRFMRFREEGGDGHYETSPDGSDWTERATFSIDSVWDPAFTSVYIGGYSSGATSDGDMHIAGVYSDGDDGSVPCAASTLSDDFDDNERSSAWYRGWFSSDCPIGESGGELRVDCPIGADASSGYVSSAAYDLRDSAVTIEVIDYPAPGASGYMALGVSRPEAETFFQFEINDGEVSAYIAVNDNWSTIFNGPYDSDAGRFMRIREEDGTMHFELSPDNQRFTSVLDYPVSFPVSEMLVFVMGGAYTPTAPVSVAFDNLNVGP